MTDQDDAIRACAREAAVQHGGFGNDGMVEVGVTAIRRWLSHRASRPPAPAPTGAALPEFPECAPGPWGISAFDVQTDGPHRWIMSSDGFSVVGACERSAVENAEIARFILARVNARLPAPATAPGVTLFCDENGRCLSRGPIFRREFAVGQDVIENGREYVVISDKPDGASRIVVLRASPPVALDMSAEDAARLEAADQKRHHPTQVNVPHGIGVPEYDLVRRLLTDAHARLAEARGELVRELTDHQIVTAWRNTLPMKPADERVVVFARALIARAVNPAPAAPVAMSEADRAAVKEYVCGFAFTEARKVALICKARPAWQEGKLNGVGGHIELGETPEQAMAREFREEAGTATNWERFAVMRGNDFAVHFFRGALISLDVTDTDEPVALFDIDAIDRDIPALPNLHWLVPMAFNPHPEEEPKEIIIGVALDYASQPRPQADDGAGVK